MTAGTGSQGDAPDTAGNRGRVIVLVQESTDEPIIVQAVPDHWTKTDVSRHLAATEFDWAVVTSVIEIEIDAPPKSRSDMKAADGGVS